MRSIFNLLLMGAVLTAILSFLAENWNTLASAPLAFGALLIIGGLIGWALARWSYRERLDICEMRKEALREDVERLKNQLADTKPSGIVESRESLEPQPSKSLASPLNLKSETLSVINITRNLVERYESKSKAIDNSPTMRNPAMQAMVRAGDPYGVIAKNKEEKRQFAESCLRQYRTAVFEKAIKCRERFLESVGDNIETLDRAKYTDPNSISELNAIANDLEFLLEVLEG